MNEKINTDIKSLKLIFDRNKSFIFPSVVILVCIVLILQVVIPQVNAFLSLREEAKKESLKLQVLKENLKVLINANDSSLDSQLKILNLALPISKDFNGILNALYYASQKTGVNLGKFSFQLGDLSQLGEKDSKSPIINVSITLNDSIGLVNQFMDELSKTVPISEVSGIKTSNSSSNLNILFHYKPLNQADSKKNLSIKPISQKGIVLIDKINNFSNVSLANLEPLSISSSLENSNPFE